jgi:hypothetical protein
VLVVPHNFAPHNTTPQDDIIVNIVLEIDCTRRPHGPKGQVIFYKVSFIAGEAKHQFSFPLLRRRSRSDKKQNNYPVSHEYPLAIFIVKLRV